MALSPGAVVRLRHQLIVECAHEAALARSHRAAADALVERTDMSACGDA